MKGLILGILIGAVGLTACSDSTTGTTGTALLSVNPANNATNVSPNASMVLTFSGPMMAGMEQYVDLHPGNLGATTMPMTCTWSVDAKTLTCTPNAPLAAGTTYLLHCGGGMQDANGHQVGMMSGPMAGTTVSSAMMPGGMHGGQPMGGMGSGWKSGGGSYGMMFSFTTTGSVPAPTALISVSPANGATNVVTNASMVLTFSAPMMAGMEQYVDLHPGNLGAATMPMTCNWSANATVLTCTPNAPMAGGTTYLLHCGGGLQDSNAKPVEMMSGPMAGTTVTSGMMPGGMHAGQPMGMMGSGWQGPGGTFGMMFSFSTP